MFGIEGFLSDSDEENSRNERLVRRNLRDASNPLSVAPNLFIKLFRLDKSAFQYVFDEISPGLKVQTRSSSIPPILKLAAALRFYAEGSYQKSVGQDYLIAMAQSTTSEIISEVTNAIENILCPKWIVFRLNDNEKMEAKQYFYEKVRFPGIIGCIDGTHVDIVKPSHNEHLYFNRKGHHSLNVMLVCDHLMRIRCVDARFGGASHDSFIWNLSSYRRYLQEQMNLGDTSSRLLGDSGYPLQPWLLTPFRAASEGSRESLFNQKHCEARNIIERTNGLLKARFRCLIGERKLHYSPKKATQLINSGCALHNIIIHYNVSLDDSIEIVAEDDSDDDDFYDENSPEQQIARRIRNQIMDSL